MQIIEGFASTKGYLYQYHITHAIPGTGQDRAGYRVNEVPEERPRTTSEPHPHVLGNLYEVRGIASEQNEIAVTLSNDHG